MSQRWPPFPRVAPRRVDGGIEARSRHGDIGETWWSRRFLAMLDSFDLGSRLSRGRTYARRGQVMHMEVRPGVVDARVQGTRVRPYRVRLGVEVLSERDWLRAERAMARKAIFAASLLAGEMPAEIEEVFAECDLSLFPTAAGQLSSSCTCPDWSSLCKHVAAVFYLLAEAFDADPFLVFTWRGRTRDQLLDRLRALRGAGPAAVPEAEPAPAEGPPVPDPGAADLERFWTAGPELDGLRLRPWEAPPAPDALVRQLGPAGVTAQGRDLGDALAEAMRLMSEHARLRAAGDEGPAGDAPAT